MLKNIFKFSIIFFLLTELLVSPRKHHKDPKQYNGRNENQASKEIKEVSGKKSRKMLEKLAKPDQLKLEIDKERGEKDAESKKDHQDSNPAVQKEGAHFHFNESFIPNFLIASDSDLDSDDYDDKKATAYDEYLSALNLRAKKDSGEALIVQKAGQPKKKKKSNIKNVKQPRKLAQKRDRDNGIEKASGNGLTEEAVNNRIAENNKEIMKKVETIVKDTIKEEQKPKKSKLLNLQPEPEKQDTKNPTDEPNEYQIKEATTSGNDSVGTNRDKENMDLSEQSKSTKDQNRKKNINNFEPKRPWSLRRVDIDQPGSSKPILDYKIIIISLISSILPLLR